jgi:hypothetical protein
MERNYIKFSFILSLTSTRYEGIILYANKPESHNIGEVNSRLATPWQRFPHCSARSILETLSHCIQTSALRRGSRACGHRTI